MIKGCAKRVVVVRNMESNLFEEAFFIVKSGQSVKKRTEEEFLGEAERLVKTTPSLRQAAENSSAEPSDNDLKPKGERFRILPKSVTYAANGTPCGAALSDASATWKKSSPKSHFLHVRDLVAFFLGFALAVGGTIIFEFLP